MSHTSPSLESRLTGWVLQHPLCQQFSFRTVNALLAIERGDDDVAPADARRLLTGGRHLQRTLDTVDVSASAGVSEASPRTAKAAPTVRDGLLNDWQQPAADHFIAAAEIDPFAEDHVATGNKVDGALIPRNATQGKGRVAIVPELGDGGADARTS